MKKVTKLSKLMPQVEVGFDRHQLEGSFFCAHHTRMFQRICMSALTDTFALFSHHAKATSFRPARCSSFNRLTPCTVSEVAHSCSWKSFLYTVYLWWQESYQAKVKEELECNCAR